MIPVVVAGQIGTRRTGRVEARPGPSTGPRGQWPGTTRRVDARLEAGEAALALRLRVVLFQRGVDDRAARLVARDGGPRAGCQSEDTHLSKHPRRSTLGLARKCALSPVSRGHSGTFAIGRLTDFGLVRGSLTRDADAANAILSSIATSQMTLCAVVEVTMPLHCGEGCSVGPSVRWTARPAAPRDRSRVDAAEDLGVLASPVCGEVTQRPWRGARPCDGGSVRFLPSAR
jgi:hypothetical protein